MTIQFILQGEENKTITNLYDLTANLFNIGDEIKLSVFDIYDYEFPLIKNENREKIISVNELIKTSFDNKKIKIVREEKTLCLKATQEPKVNIIYYCELI